MIISITQAQRGFLEGISEVLLCVCVVNKNDAVSGAHYA